MKGLHGDFYYVIHFISLQNKKKKKEHIFVKGLHGDFYYVIHFISLKNLKKK